MIFWGGNCLYVIISSLQLKGVRLTQSLLFLSVINTEDRQLFSSLYVLRFSLSQPEVEPLKENPLNFNTHPAKNRLIKMAKKPTSSSKDNKIEAINFFSLSLIFEILREMFERTPNYHPNVNLDVTNAVILMEQIMKKKNAHFKSVWLFRNFIKAALCS